MRVLLITALVVPLLTGPVVAQDSVPVPPVAPSPVLPVGDLPTVPVSLPAQTHTAQSTGMSLHPEQSHQPVVDVLPVLDSVQAWYFPKGKLGQRARLVFWATVDTLGRIDPETIRLVSSTDSTFNDAGRLTLMVTYYHPGLSGGHPVRVFVQQAIKYDRQSLYRACELTRFSPMLPPRCDPPR